MSTTTIRIEDDLKARIASAAERVGKSAHAFVRDAIAQSVEQAEIDAEFHNLAEERWARILATGKTVPWDATRSYLEARARGERRVRPQAKQPHR